MAFEIKPRNDPFSIDESQYGYRRAWLPWGRSSSKIVPSSSNISRTMSRASSHFCDLVGDEDEDEDLFLSIEEGLEEDESQKHWQIPFLFTSTLSKREQPSKPSKPKNSRLSVIPLDQGLFTVYKRLFVVCLVLNITSLVLAATGNFPYGRIKATLFAIGNPLALTLCRSEAFLRVVCWIAVNLLGYSFVPVKTATTALLQSLGGIHSSCAISLVSWLTYSLVFTLKDRDNTSTEIIGIASAILSLLSLSCVLAFPLIRHLHHNLFERTHRFTRWASLVLLWAFLDAKGIEQNFGKEIKEMLSGFPKE